MNFEESGSISREEELEEGESKVESEAVKDPSTEEFLEEEEMKVKDLTSC